MKHITVVQKKDELTDPEKLYSLIHEQMHAIGSDRDYSHIKQAVEHALNGASNSVFFLYHIDNGPAAFAFGNICSGLETGADYLWINELFVENKFRRQNIASALLSYIEEWSKQRKIKYIACITGENNTQAQSLYAKNGYELSSGVWVDKSID